MGESKNRIEITQSVKTYRIEDIQSEWSKVGRSLFSFLKTVVEMTQHECEELQCNLKISKGAAE